MVRVQVSLSDTIGAAIKSKSEETGQSMSAVCAFYISQYLDAQKGMDSIQGLVQAYQEAKAKEAIEVKDPTPKP